MTVFILIWAESAPARESQFIIISSTVDCGYKRAMGELKLASDMKEMHNLWETYLHLFDYWPKGIDRVLELLKVRLEGVLCPDR